MKTRSIRTGRLWALAGSITRQGTALLALLVVVLQPLAAQGLYYPGEKLRYKVRWSFIRLGTLEIEQRMVDPRTPDVRRFVMTVKSAPGLPFIDLDFTHTATVAIDPLEARRLFVETRHGDQVNTTYEIESSNKRLIVTDSCQGKQTLCDTIAIAQQCYEALSLLLLARSQASTHTTTAIATVVGGSVGETVLKFSGRTEKVKVPALDVPLEAYHFTGDARWVGSDFAGMSGDFRGWISRDEAAVPLRAEVDIFLGSIILELESFERSNWHPSDTVSASLLLTR